MIGSALLVVTGQPLSVIGRKLRFAAKVRARRGDPDPDQLGKRPALPWILMDAPRRNECNLGRRGYDTGSSGSKMNGVFAGASGCWLPHSPTCRRHPIYHSPRHMGARARARWCGCSFSLHSPILEVVATRLQHGGLIGAENLRFSRTLTPPV